MKNQYKAKCLSKSDEVKSLQHKQKLKAFITRNPDLKEIIKAILQYEIKEH
jgi:hypothetical protein